MLLAATTALAAGIGNAGAQTAADTAGREQARARMQAERTRVEDRFKAEMAVCQHRFIVTACEDEARLRRRDGLALPRAEGLALDDIERRERAVARRETVQAKQREAATRTAPTAPASAALPKARRAPDASAVFPPRDDPAAAASAQAVAQQRALAARERRAEIEATQARIRARQAERLRQGKSAAPLPVPAPDAAGPAASR